MKSQVLHAVWCNIPGEAAGEIWNWSLLGVKGLNMAQLISCFNMIFTEVCWLVWQQVVHTLLWKYDPHVDTSDPPPLPSGHLTTSEGSRRTKWTIHSMKLFSSFTIALLFSIIYTREGVKEATFTECTVQWNPITKGFQVSKYNRGFGQMGMRKVAVI